MQTQKAIDKAWEQSRMLQAAIFLATRLPVTDFDFPVAISINATPSEGCVYVDIPYDLKCLRKFRQAMGEGWKPKGVWVNTQHHDNTIHRHQSYKLGNVDKAKLILSLDTDMGSRTCYVKQVGTKEIPVMEVVCE